MCGYKYGVTVVYYSEDVYFSPSTNWQISGYRPDGTALGIHIQLQYSDDLFMQKNTFLVVLDWCDVLHKR